ncbi:MAG: helix-turn-helix transcriptional regulator [Eubacteriales bacterium]|nr:helix-turn-helix transcriptional regulator [Eubacteriales bacterium]
MYTRLRDLREDADMNQTKVAEILGTNQNQYSRRERGEREIPLNKFIELAKYYKVSLDYLAGLTNKR